MAVLRNLLCAALIILFAANTYALDTHPWINTLMYENLKNAASYTPEEISFIGDHYDILVGHVNEKIIGIKTRNPETQVLDYAGLASMMPYYQQRYAAFLATRPDINFSGMENIYLHFKCDTTIHGNNHRGCNLADNDTGLCSGTPASGCTASTALNITESRVPVYDQPYYSQGWLEPNFRSDTYKDFGAWRLLEIFSYYPPGSRPDGMWWDNILYLETIPEIENTIEYFGKPNNIDHERNHDYHDYFANVTKALLQKNEVNSSFTWLGNVDAMYYIRETGPHIAWVLGNLSHFTPESWVSPRGRGEYYMPSWSIDCADMGEAWTYTTVNNRNMTVMSYNYRDIYGEDNMTQVFSLARYYLAKDRNLYYTYREDSQGANFTQTEWNPMADINLGALKANPAGVRDFRGNTGTDLFFDWANPTQGVNCDIYSEEHVVMARHFENGLVIARWKGARYDGTPPAGDPRYNSDVDPRTYALTNPYGTAYYLINIDGDIGSAPVQSVTLATNQAAILLQVCPEGPVTATCGCQGIVKNPGDSCITTCEDQRYDPDCDGHITGEGVTLAITDWLDGMITMNHTIAIITRWKG